MDEKVLCEKCGAEYGIGSFPFCRGRQEDHGVMQGFDDAFEPYVDVQLLDRNDPRCTSVNHLGMRGVPIGSRSERRALMREKEVQFGSQRFDSRGSRLYFDQGRRA